MGIDFVAVGEDDPLIEKVFYNADLDSNLRYCQIPNWEDVVCICLELDDFSDICWIQHPPDVVKSWLQIAKNHVFNVPCFNAQKIINFLEICVGLNASIRVF
jgi:hypothetical protein